MRVTKRPLRRIIREEKWKLLAENRVRRTVRRALREYMNPGEVRDPNRVEGDGSVVLSIFGNQSESIDEVVQAENYYGAPSAATWRWATPEETALLLPDEGTPHERALVLTGPWNDIVRWYWEDTDQDLNDGRADEYQAVLPMAPTGGGTQSLDDWFESMPRKDSKEEILSMVSEDEVKAAGWEDFDEAYDFTDDGGEIFYRLSGDVQARIKADLGVF